MAGGTFDEGLHPRASDGKWGAGGGSPKKSAPKQGSESKAKATARAATAKAKVAAARAAAKEKATAIVAKAKERAKGLIDKAKARQPTSRAGKAPTKEAKAKVAAARVVAKEKARQIVAKAKERAQATIAKARGKTAAQKSVRTESETSSAGPVKPPQSDARNTLAPLAKSAADAMAKGDLGSARAALEDHIRALGLSQNHSRSGEVGVVPAAEIGNAAGVHGWDGKILLATETAAAIPMFASRLGGSKMDPEGDRREHQELLNRRNLIAERADRAKGKAREQLRQEFEQAEERRQQVFNRLHGDVGMYEAHALVHETMHGFSPGTMDSYQGHGAKIEEITTEVSARRISNDLFGIPHPHATDVHSAYHSYIKAATDAISEATGHPHEVAYGHLERASLDYKKLSSRSLESPAEVHAAFADSVAKVTGVSPKAMFDAMSRHLSKAN